MKKFFTRTVNVWLLAALCCLLWGSAFPAIKRGYALFEIAAEDTATIILFAGIRFALAGFLTVLAASLLQRKALLPTRKSLKKIGVLSLFQTVLQYVFFYLGLAFTTGARGSVINGTSVFFALLISSLLFKMEKLRLSKIIGCLVGFAGVVLVSLDAFVSTGGSFIGEAFILLSSIAYAFSSVFMKRYTEDDNPAMLSGWQFMLGGVVMCVAGLCCGGRLTAVSGAGIALLLYLSFLSAAAYTLWSVLLKYNPVSKVAVCGFMIPVFGFILSSLFAGEGEKTGLLSLAALLLVAVGMVIVNADITAKKANKL